MTALNMKWLDPKTLELIYHVHKDKVPVVGGKINNIIDDGPDKLQLITDFDFTLTKQFGREEEKLPTWRTFDRSDQLPENIRKDFDGVYSRWYSIVNDSPDNFNSCKIDALMTLMQHRHKLLAGIKYDDRELETLTRVYGNKLRVGTRELFTKLTDLRIPILIFSAGCGDIIRQLLIQQKIPLDTVTIISNFLQFYRYKLMGLKNYESLVVSCNKNNHPRAREYFRSLPQRKNVILLGDRLSDAMMAETLENPRNVLKFGLLNDKDRSSSGREDFVSPKLELYRGAFDMVVDHYNYPMDLISDFLSRFSPPEL